MTAKAKRGLGKGLGAFFGEEIVQEVVRPQENGKEKEDKTIVSDHSGKAADKAAKKEAASGMNAEKREETPQEFMVKVSAIEPNRQQPRKDFNQEQMDELAESIRQFGILQPLLVQKREHTYELIAGERRWRAAKLAGLTEVPVVVREYSKQQSVEIALIENVQRADLNAIEEAMAYQQLMQEFGLTQEEIAQRVSKNRATITNSIRLLKLDPNVQQMLAENRITSGHGRALLMVEDPEVQKKLADQIEKEAWNVRQTEKAVKLLDKKPEEKKKSQQDEALALIFHDLEERMKSIMGTKVVISKKDRNKGRIEIEYYSESELERIVELIESIR